MATDNLLDRLLPSDFEVDHYEVLAVLERHLGPPGQDGPGKLIYPDCKEYAIRVRWGNGSISRIEGGPGLGLIDLDSLKVAVREELSESPHFAQLESKGIPLHRIERAILFSSPQKVAGYFRTPDLQLLPAPGPAKQDADATEHPFYIEFSVPMVQNSMIRDYRRWRIARQTALVLNALLRTHVRLKPRPATSLWAVCRHTPNEPEAEQHSHWTQELYIDPDFRKSAVAFTEPHAPPIPQIPHDEYYGYYAKLIPVRLVTQGLLLPDSLESMLAAFAKLDRADRMRFVRAAQWIGAAYAGAWHNHMSSHFVALVSAVESLATELTDGPRCEKCGQIKGVTQRFADFVEKYAGRDTGETKAKKALYSLRSQLTHGSGLLAYDDYLSIMMIQTPYFFEHLDAFVEMAELVRRVAVGWLRDKGERGDGA